MASMGAGSGSAIGAPPGSAIVSRSFAAGASASGGSLASGSSWSSNPVASRGSPSAPCVASSCTSEFGGLAASPVVGPGSAPAVPLWGEAASAGAWSAFWQPFKRAAPRIIANETTPRIDFVGSRVGMTAGATVRTNHEACLGEKSSTHSLSQLVAFAGLVRVCAYVCTALSRCAMSLPMVARAGLLDHARWPDECSFRVCLA